MEGLTGPWGACLFLTPYSFKLKAENEWPHDELYSHFRIYVKPNEEIRNGKIRLSKGNQMVGFEIFGIAIGGNEQYPDTEMTMGMLVGHHLFMYIYK